MATSSSIKSCRCRLESLSLTQSDSSDEAETERHTDPDDNSRKQDEDFYRGRTKHSVGEHGGSLHTGSGEGSVAERDEEDAGFDAIGRRDERGDPTEVGRGVERRDEQGAVVGTRILGGNLPEQRRGTGAVPEQEK